METAAKGREAREKKIPVARPGARIIPTPFLHSQTDQGRWHGMVTLMYILRQVRLTDIIGSCTAATNLPPPSKKKAKKKKDFCFTTE